MTYKKAYQMFEEKTTITNPDKKIGGIKHKMLRRINFSVVEMKKFERNAILLNDVVICIKV